MGNRSEFGWKDVALISGMLSMFFLVLFLIVRAIIG